MDPLIGRTVGHYVLQEKLGSGGFGTVYRAVHLRMRRICAVKILPPHLAQDPAFVQRFEREARLAAELHHPNIVGIYDIGEDSGFHYIAMPLLEGGPLSGILRSGRPPFERALAILRQLANALDHAHARGVIHRDLKPANIMVGPDGQVTLVDFGIARAAEAAAITATGAVAGTAAYMAPEAVMGGAAGPSVDLYALGVVAYELITGQPPFPGSDTPRVMFAQAYTPPPPARAIRPDLSPGVEAVLQRQLAKDPAQRFPSALAFVDALAATLSQTMTMPAGGAWLPPAPGPPPPRTGEPVPPLPTIAVAGSFPPAAVPPAAFPPRPAPIPTPATAPFADAAPARRRVAPTLWILLVAGLLLLLFIAAGLAIGGVLIAGRLSSGPDTSAQPAATPPVAAQTAVPGATRTTPPAATSQPLPDGSWAAVAPMNQARSGHTLTVLAGGQVLAAGGTTRVGEALNSAEIYDPARAAWTATGSLAAGRYFHTASLLTNGKVLVAGGSDLNNKPLDSAELFDPGTGRWSSAGTMATAHSGHTATVLAGGQVLIVAGYATDYLATAELYDPATNRWSSAGRMAAARIWHTATLLPSGKVMVTGGAASAQAEIFDPTTRAWTAAGQMATPRSFASAAALADGRVLVIGGEDKNGAPLAAAEIYNPATNAWSAAGAMAQSRVRFAALRLADGRVVVAGGANKSNAASQHYASVELYDPAQNTWRTIAPLSSNRAGPSAVLLANGGLLLTGGYDATHNAFTTAEVFTPPRGR